jgi:type I restriction enzyme S subunit
MRLKALVSNPTDKVDDPGLPFVALEHLESGSGRLLPGVELEGKEADDSVAHAAGDVRFGKLRPYLAKSFLAETAGAGSGELLVLRPGPRLLSRYLWYVTLSQSFVDWAVATSYGVKMPRTSWAALGAFEIDPPALGEQQRIVQILDSALAQIDELASEQLRLLELTNEHWRGVLEDTVWSDAGLPVVRLSELIDRARPLTYGVVLAGDHVDDGVPLVEAGTILQGGFRVDPPKKTEPVIERQYARSRLVPGDVLMAIRGSVGRVAVVPPEMSGWNITRDVALIAPDCEQVLPEWLLLALWSPRTQSSISLVTSGSAVRGINLAHLARVPISLPTLQAQAVLVERAGDVWRRLGQVDSEARLQVSLLREHRQALISAAVTGGLDGVRKVA